MAIETDAFLLEQIHAERSSPGHHLLALPIVQETNELHDAENSHEAERVAKYARIKWMEPFIPEANPNHRRSKTFRRKLSKRNVMLRIQSGIVVFTLWANVGLIIWLARDRQPDRSRQVGTITEGLCSHIRSIDSMAHGGINILSSLFLGAGNYCMQLLCAPKRSDINKAHERGFSLDIGVPSFANLLHISRKRAALWGAFGICSVFLHLIWNSAIFISFPFVQFLVAMPTTDFMAAQDNWASSSAYIPPGSEPNRTAIFALRQRAADFKRLDRVACLKEVADPLTTTRDIILVTNVTTEQNGGDSLLHGWVSGSDTDNWAAATESWICGGFWHRQPSGSPIKCSALTAATILEDEWLVSDGSGTDVNIEYCLVGEAGDNLERCGFHYSLHVILILLGGNALHAALVLGIAFSPPEGTFVTMGDALSDFLQPGKRDNLTKTCGTIVQRPRRWQRFARRRPVDFSPAVWDTRSTASYAEGVSPGFRLLASTVLLALIGTCAGLLVMAFEVARWYGLHFAYFVSQGVKKRPIFELIGGYWFSGSNARQLLWQVFSANFFQILVSIAYLFYNSLVTRQAVAEEWSRLLRPGERKALRTSAPISLQRSSYLLSLPLRYSVVLKLSFILLHWLVSQSIFLVQIRTFLSGPEDRRLPGRDVSRLGYSTLWTTVTLCYGILLVSGLGVYSQCRKYKGVPPTFPIVGYQSLGLSAVCHPSMDDEDAHLFPVTLGVIPIESRDGETAQDCAGRLVLSTWTGLDQPLQGEKYVYPHVAMHPSPRLLFARVWKRVSSKVSGWLAAVIVWGRSRSDLTRRGR